MNVVLEAGVAIYVALAVALAVWLGIVVYLWRLDAQVRELRRRLENLPRGSSEATPTATLRAQQPHEQPLSGVQEPQAANAKH
jgi:CcmD family protein